MKELFKPIDWVKDIPKDKYFISNMGRVYNAWNDNFTKQCFRNGRRSFSVRFYDDRNNRVRNGHLDVAMAVAIAFIPLPDGYDIDSVNQLWVNHKDMNVDNNHASNLEWTVRINHLTGLCITVEALYMMYELLLKYYNNRTQPELIEIIHNETGILLTTEMLYNMCRKTHSEKSIIGKAFGLVGTSIKEEALRRDLMLRPIVSEALKGTFKEHPDEKWVWLKYPGVKKEYYIISNYGRIYNKFDQEISIIIDKTKHCNVSLAVDNTNKNNIKPKKSTLFSLARLVAWHFCNFPKGVEEHELNNIIVKCKDANSMNVKYDNLYWTTHQGATRYGIDIDKVRDVIDYVKSLVDKGLELNEITLLTNHKFGLNHTSAKYRFMITRSKRDDYNPTYDVLDIDQRTMRKRSPRNTPIKLSNDEVRSVCKMLVEYNGNSGAVYRKLEETSIPDISYGTIREIRAGRSHRDVSKDFFEPDDFRHDVSVNINVMTLTGGFIKQYKSLAEMADDKELISSMPSYNALAQRFRKGNGFVIIENYVFQKIQYFTPSREGCKLKTTSANVILELDRDDNIVHVYFGRKDAARTFGVIENTISTWIKNGKVLENGNHLINMGRKKMPVEK